ncbi:MAG: cell division protein FtsZ [Bacteroidetes bacterium]|nr:cell division protein FtsZ [Bacteroidota bacterium]MBS1630164.1 cell division protein FtsZ [Bacteroidota bacterium]
MIHFEIPKNQSSILKVIGVGGGGSNAVNYMYKLNLEGVDFVVCNTDSQSLADSPVPNKIQLGPHLTQGLGAGANPEIGKQASEESMDDISKILKVNTKMAFITAGMGGGTGTGGAPVVAKVCRELGILTVGIVTTPFAYEGRKRLKQAQEGIDRLREYVDTILIISNDKLRQQFGNLPFSAAFAKADNVLATAAKCITDVITTSGDMNLDFADVTAVMKNGGVAILGAAQVAGEQRALKAVEEAISSPLLNDNDIRGAKWILLNVTSAPGEHEHTLDELDDIQAYLQQQAGDNCDIILGLGHDDALGECIGVTVIATGFNYQEIKDLPERPKESERKIFVRLGEQPTGAQLLNELPQRLSEPDKTEQLAPRLSENNNKESAPLKPLPIPMAEQPRRFPLHLESRLEEPDTAIPSPEPGISEMKLTIREELPETSPVVIGGHTLSQDEIAERQRFEQQKRDLEERAERLRRLSFNIRGSEGMDDMEHTPAYVRRNMELPEEAGSNDSSLFSGMSVGPNEGPGVQATIHTINTFLDGKKPD